MNDDDDLSKTMVIPNPGGRRKTASAEPQYTPPQVNTPSNPPPTQNHAPNYANSDSTKVDVNCENVILRFASDILVLAGSLRTLEPSNSIEQLRADIENLFSNFQLQLKQRNTPEEITLTARYMLCCLIDELVLTTPWGIESSWSHQTLLGKYHNETSGGEKFFLIINKLLEQAQRNIDLIELSYLCLSLGFRGKYRLSQTGENDVSQIAQMLYQPLSLHRPTSPELSPSWQSDAKPEKTFESKVPPILFFLILGFVCIAVYIALLSNLHAKSSPIYEKIEQIGWDNFVLQMSDAQSEDLDLGDIASSISARLSDSIAKQQIVVDIKDDLLVIRLVSLQLFPPGSTDVNQNELPAVETLVSAINPYADAVVVVGHTDSTGRADSNWAISRKRAESIEQWIKSARGTVPQTITRGVADTQPLVQEGDSDFNQSLNRRVELILVLKDDLTL